MLQSYAEGKVVVQLVLPLPWLARINQLAIERGVNRSALIREAIRAAYFNGGDAQPLPDAPTRKIRAHSA
jgi:ribbon-helix-helix CopG family protein